jgi:hypothetical protein
VTHGVLARDHLRVDVGLGATHVLSSSRYAGAIFMPAMSKGASAYVHKPSTVGRPRARRGSDCLLSLEDLLVNNRAVDRPQDRLDVEKLERARR